ncbi:hypothetical protein HHL16_24495 [Pseudoflavitalea sp. G-6-1-2]|uniref:DUF6660 family protein n=1 Tax=Pseudoflavitalea sp. G-6-1-2 TaxID=2728841 RepID=UPI00146EE031|nr:DUF6660 family protein [Pseudoflavitalea sp. G-6-1-2]NML24060.1 hypothetical protein [Pseudoflavitalea sp. G-6-1-2]
MRLIGYLIAMLVIVLGFVPCSDTHRPSRSLTIVQQPDEHAHEEYCSPFCHCSCCAITSISHEVPELIIPPTTHTAHNATPYTDEVLEVSIPVWQPPQLG